MSVWQEAETDFLYRVYVFFRRRTDFVVLTRKNTVAILQSDIRRHTDFSLETSDRFHPLNFYFLFLISFFSFTRTSCGLNIVGNAPFATFFYPKQGLHDVFGVEMLRTYV